jgi:hypothetical protein
MVRALRTAEEAGFDVKSFKINKAGEIVVEVGPPILQAQHKSEAETAS